MKKGNAVWTLIGLIFFAVVIYFLARESTFITDLLHKSGAWAPILAVMIYPLLAPTPITTDPVTIVMGVTYGPLAGASIALIGNVLAALVEYYLGLRIGKASNFEKTKDRMPFGLGKMPVNSIGFLVLGRMIPGYGGKIISILAGTYKVPIKRYLWTTILTNLLGSLILAYGGFGLIEGIKISNILRNLGLQF